MPKASGAAGQRGSKKKAASAKLSIKQVRSGIGHAATYRRTLEALGLRHYQQTVVLADNPSIRGMLFKVRHLVEVTPVQEA
jgi:large subunit ribosomal protein L30